MGQEWMGRNYNHICVSLVNIMMILESMEWNEMGPSCGISSLFFFFLVLVLDLHT